MPAAHHDNPCIGTTLPGAFHLQLAIGACNIAFIVTKLYSSYWAGFYYESNGTYPTNVHLSDCLMGAEDDYTRPCYVCEAPTLHLCHWLALRVQNP